MVQQHASHVIPMTIRVNKIRISYRLLLAAPLLELADTVLGEGRRRERELRVFAADRVVLLSCTAFAFGLVRLDQRELLSVGTGWSAGLAATAALAYQASSARVRFWRTRNLRAGVITSYSRPFCSCNSRASAWAMLTSSSPNF